MFKHAWKWYRTGPDNYPESMSSLIAKMIFHAMVVIGVVLIPIFVFGGKHSPKTLNGEQRAQIEKLATLHQYDMVLHQDGYIHMVAYRPREDPENKAHWEITLRRDYEPVIDFRSYRLSTLVDEVVMIIPQDDPKWAVAARCYLKEAKCPEVLAQ